PLEDLHRRPERPGGGVLVPDRPKHVTEEQTRLRHFVRELEHPHPLQCTPERSARRPRIPRRGLDPAPRLRRDREKPGRRLLIGGRSEEHTSELQSLAYLVCRL